MKRTVLVASILLVLAYSQLPTPTPLSPAIDNTMPTVSQISKATPMAPAVGATIAPSTGLPNLDVVGTQFLADGRPIRLTGAAANHFFWNNISWSSFVQFKQDVKMLKDWGGNFVVVDFNSGFLGDPTYVQNLVEGLEYARSLGLRVELVLHSRGMKDQDTPQQILAADGRLIQDWEGLLSDPDRSARIAHCVDIFGILSEPQYNRVGRKLDWTNG
jgi:hypothetical protein